MPLMFLQFQCSVNGTFESGLTSLQTRGGLAETIDRRQDRRAIKTQSSYVNVGITVIRRINKEVIRITISFQDVQCRETLALAGTRENLRYAEWLHAEILRKIKHSTFRYDEYFPS